MDGNREKKSGRNRKETKTTKRGRGRKDRQMERKIQVLVEGVLGCELLFRGAEHRLRLQVRHQFLARQLRDAPLDASREVKHIILNQSSLSKREHSNTFSRRTISTSEISGSLSSAFSRRSNFCVE
jgi:hypothetical protein